jgi:hypothetical protein
MTYLSTISRFLVDWIKLATVAGPWPMWLVKGK